MSQSRSPYYDFDGEPIDQLTWARLFEDTEGRRVARTDLDGVEVSTVWLGLDHGFGTRASSPLIYETMIFGGSHDEDCWRYPTREAALAGHDQAVALVRDALLLSRDSESED